MKGTLSVAGLIIGFGLVSVAVAKVPDKWGPTQCSRGADSESGQAVIKKKLAEMAKAAERPTTVVRTRPWRIMGDMPILSSLETRVAALGPVAPPKLTKEEQRRIDFIELIEAIDGLAEQLDLPKSGR